jgi:hypothetical protein
MLLCFENCRHIDLTHGSKHLIANFSQAQLQARYAIHRTTRNGQQKAKLLSSEFSGLILDPILQRLADPAIEPGFIDPRNWYVHCFFVAWYTV